MWFKTLMVFLGWITFAGVYVLGQCPLTQDVTPAPTAIPLSLVLQESASQYQQFADEIDTLIIERETIMAETGERIEETLWVSGNRYRLKRTRQRESGPSTLTYLFDGEQRWIITPSGQWAKTSLLETPQPYVDWSQWINQNFELDGLGNYMDHPIFMLQHPDPSEEDFKEVWIDAERLLPLMVRQDTTLGRTVTVFADYQLLEGTQAGWIPWTRELYREGELLERTNILDIIVNEPLDDALFEVER